MLQLLVYVLIMYVCFWLADGGLNMILIKLEDAYRTCRAKLKSANRRD